jgi:4-amino-4-deoxy-L-arabinose transferase-like glycosyltransferase
MLNREIADNSRGVHLVLLVLIVLFSLAYFISNMSADLIRAGEGRAAEIAREMLERGNFVLPSLNHVVNAHSLTKPPLYHWMLIATGAPFDWQNWAMRLTTVISALGSIWVVFLFGRQMFGYRAALFSALVLSTSIVFLENSSAARMDVFFSFLILSSIYCFWMAINRSYESWWIHCFYALSGLGVLTKGPVGLLFPALVAIILFVSSNSRDDWRRFVPLTGVLLFLAVTLPWYILMATTAPPGLASFFLFGQLAHWWAGSSNVAASGGKPFTYYLPHIVVGLFPWSLLLPAAVVIGYRAAREEGNAGIKSLLIWFLGGFILFSLGGKKAARYLLPIMAPFALIVGFYLDRLGETISKRHGIVLNVSSILVLLFVVAITVLIAAIYVDPDWVINDLFKGQKKGGDSQLRSGIDMLLQHPLPVVIAVVLMFSASTAAVVGSFKKNLYLIVFGLAVVIWTLVLPFSLTVKPALQQEMSPRFVAEKIKDMIPQYVELYGGGGEYQHSIRWYLERNITMEPVEKLYNRVLHEPASWVLLMDKKPPEDRLFQSGRDTMRWQVEYYHITLFPGHILKTDIKRDN